MLWIIRGVRTCRWSIRIEIDWDKLIRNSGLQRNARRLPARCKALALSRERVRCVTRTCQPIRYR